MTGKKSAPPEVWLLFGTAGAFIGQAESKQRLRRIFGRATGDRVARYIRAGLATELPKRATRELVERVRLEMGIHPGEATFVDVERWVAATLRALRRPKKGRK